MPGPYLRVRFEEQIACNEVLRTVMLDSTSVPKQQTAKSGPCCGNVQYSCCLFSQRGSLSEARLSLQSSGASVVNGLSCFVGSSLPIGLRHAML